MSELLLGIDIGTSGCKLSAVDRLGDVVDSAFGELHTARPRPGWSEQEPDDWYCVTCRLLSEMFARGRCRPEQIAAVGLDGSTHNAVLADDEFHPLRPAIMWTDQRSVRQAARLRADHGEHIFQTTYQTPSPTWTLPQMAWLDEHEPDVPRRAKHVLFTKDYVRYQLTGAWHTDHIEAQGSMLYDMAARDWSVELCQLAGLAPEALPPLVEPADVVGAVTPAAARATGLRAGTPVVSGTSDSAIEGYAAGAIQPGQMILKLATAGNVNVMTAKPHPHPSTLTYSHVIPGLWYTVAATNTAASAERWFRDLFCEQEAAEARRDGTNVYQRLHALAADVSPGADGLIFHPYLLGERAPYWDAQLRASFVGATMRHAKGHFVRALLEGVAMSLRDCYRVIEEMGLRVDEVRLIGGGARSDLWTQIVADVFNRPIVRPAGGDASFGAALVAGVGVGVFSGATDAVRQCVRVGDVVEPRAEGVEIYAQRFPVYRTIHDQLAPVYAAMRNA